MHDIDSDDTLSGASAVVGDGDKYIVPALERGLRLLGEFGRDSRTLSAPELARRLDLPRSTVFPTPLPTDAFQGLPARLCYKGSIVTSVTASRIPLQLVSATVDLLDAAIEDQLRLGRLLGAAIADDWAGFPESLPGLRSSCARGPGGGSWGTFLFVHQDPRTLVGMGGFKGGPSREGVVEIGYAIAPAFQGRGLATEAARQMVERAFADPAVRAVDAHTLAEENPSTGILRKLGFARIGEQVDPDDGPIWHWRVGRPGSIALASKSSPGGTSSRAMP